MAQLTEVQTNLIKSIALKEGLRDFDLVTNVGAIKGDNYLGNITVVSVKHQEGNLELILKSASASEKLRVQIPIRQAYLREIYLYETIFPEFDKFQKEGGLVDGFSSYPKIYGSCDKEPNECLVLKNLKEAGYELCDRRKTMDEKHVAMVFAEYGKFHGISLAMREKKRELYQKLTENMQKSIFASTSPNEEESAWIRRTIRTGFKAIKDNRAATVAFERFSLVALKFLQEDIQVAQEKIVIMHGDGWCNNLLFKYEDPQDSTKPTTICILDWQISSIGSPVMDLAYFFFVCSPKEILYDYKKYLKIYHDSVCKTLRGLSCDPEIVFPYAMLEHHWKKYAKYGLYVAIMLIKLMVGNSDEVPDMAEIAESGKSLVDGFSFETVHDNDYKQRITDIVMMMSDTGLI